MNTINPTVHTYFEQIKNLGTGSDGTLELWKKSWRNHGWETRVLTEADARIHPLYDAFREKIRSFPSLNKAGFDYHAFMRHLAVAALPGAEPLVSTEPDVINYSLPPDDPMLSGIPDRLTCHTAVPAFLIGTPKHFDDVCAAIISHNLREEDTEFGKPHMSDQNFFAYYGEPYGLVKYYRESPVCVEYLSPGWKTAPTVHYGTPAMVEGRRIPKDAHIPVLRFGVF